MPAISLLKNRTILVTGEAGYIGSHTSRQPVNAGCKLALAHLFAGGSSEILNCGYGTGFSVREILEAVKEVNGVQFKIIETNRRAGDPLALISDPQRIKELFAWQPTLQDIRLICETAYNWEKTGAPN